MSCYLIKCPKRKSPYERVVMFNIHKYHIIFRECFPQRFSMASPVLAMRFPHKGRQVRVSREEWLLYGEVVRQFI